LLPNFTDIQELINMIRNSCSLGLAAALCLLAARFSVAADAPVIVDAGCAPQVNCCPQVSCCPATCCPEKVCQSVPDTKKVVKRVYGDKCEDFCLCRPTLFGGLFNLQEAIAKDRGCDASCGACESCACGSCGNPHVKKYLLIHNREHEECATKCVVVEQGCPAAPCADYGVPTASVVAPPMPMPKASTESAAPRPLPPGR
jgi:hypothetical protein